MAIAFFDFDGTLIRYESGVICALPCIRRGLIAPRLAARLVTTYLLSKAGLRTRTDAQRVGFECYRGLRLQELRSIMQALHNDHLVKFLSKPVIARVREHQGRGDFTVILTASAFFFAEPIARELGIDELVGTRVGFENGDCTGLVEGSIVEGAAKLEAARRIAHARNEDLRNASFYSDHVADLPLFEEVGRPIAVGSSAKLIRVARARGWTTLAHGA